MDANKVFSHPAILDSLVRAIYSMKSEREQRHTWRVLCEAVPAFGRYTLDDLLQCEAKKRILFSSNDNAMEDLLACLHQWRIKKP